MVKNQSPTIPYIEKAEAFDYVIILCKWQICAGMACLPDVQDRHYLREEFGDLMPPEVLEAPKRWVPKMQASSAQSDAEGSITAAKEEEEDPASPWIWSTALAEREREREREQTKIRETEKERERDTQKKKKYIYIYII